MRRNNNAGGATINPPSDMIGSWITITIDRPMSDIRSRPKAVIMRLITCDTGIGAGGEPGDEL